MKSDNNWAWDMAVLITGVVIIILIFLGSVGCASLPGLYAELGAGVQIESGTSYILREECHTAVLFDENGRPLSAGRPRSCGGDDPQATFSLGWEFRDGALIDRVEWLHDSNYFDGGSNREAHSDQLRVVKKWGGRE